MNADSGTLLIFRREVSRERNEYVFGRCCEPNHRASQCQHQHIMSAGE